MNALFFIALPYVALVLAIGGSIHRYRTSRYTWSSLSSQILENRRLFWGSVPWHYGITLILAGSTPSLTRTSWASGVKAKKRSAAGKISFFSSTRAGSFQTGYLMFSVEVITSGSPNFFF